MFTLLNTGKLKIVKKSNGLHYLKEKQSQTAYLTVFSLTFSVSFFWIYTYMTYQCHCITAQIKGQRRASNKY